MFVLGYGCGCCLEGKSRNGFCCPFGKNDVNTFFGPTTFTLCSPTGISLSEGPMHPWMAPHICRRIGTSIPIDVRFIVGFLCGGGGKKRIA